MSQEIKVKGYTFKDWLNKNSTVLDFGACVGKFSEEIIKRYGCKVVAYEPNIANLEKLWKVKGLIVEPFAIGTKNENVMFFDYGKYSGSTRERRNFENVEVDLPHATPYKLEGKYIVRQLAFEDVLTCYEEIDLLKMDIEGAEMEILAEAGDELRRCKQIVMEFHCTRVQGFEYGEKSASEIVRQICGLGFDYYDRGSFNVSFVR